MLQEKLDVILDGDGKIAGIDHEVKMNNMGIREFAAMVRDMNKRGNKGTFLKQCKIVGVIPMLLPDGDFSPDKTALNLNKDETDWFLKRRPDFNTDR